MYAKHVQGSAGTQESQGRWPGFGHVVTGKVARLCCWRGGVLSAETPATSGTFQPLLPEGRGSRDLGTVDSPDCVSLCDGVGFSDSPHRDNQKHLQTLSRILWGQNLLGKTQALN